MKATFNLSSKKYVTICVSQLGGVLYMEIMITAAAAEKLNERINGREGYLKLKYDTEDCGCAVNGVIALWFVPELDADDITFETNGRNVYIEKSKTVFFDEKMTIDFSNASNTFQLKSPQQILNGYMSFVVTEKAD